MIYKNGRQIDEILVGSIAPNLQDKSINITENGDTTVSADAGYDGLRTVSINTNVSGGGGDVEIIECTSLSITAKGVQYDQTTTTINYVAECLGKQAGEIVQLRVDGTATSEDFGTNDTTEDKTITISYTFKNKTATTTIVQKWNNPDNPDLLEYEWDTDSYSQSIVKINYKNYTFTSSPVKTDLKIDLGIDKFTSAYEMFDGNRSRITKLITIPDTKDVTDMSNMFSDCSELTSLDLSGWNTQNVTDMSYMFTNCSYLTSLDLSGWKLNSDVDTYGMFDNCSELTLISMRGCNQTTIDKINEGIANSDGIDKGQITIVTV